MQIFLRKNYTPQWTLLDGLAVGPVEVVAESGSNVQIKNTFNIYVVGDGLSADAIARVAEEAEDGVTGGERSHLIVRTIERSLSRDQRASKTEDLPAAAEEKPNLSPQQVTRGTTTVASTSNPIARAPAAAQKNTSRTSAREAAAVGNRGERGKQTARPAAAPSTTSSAARTSTARRPQPPQEGSLEAVEQPSNGRNRETNKQRNSRHTNNNNAPPVAAADASLEAVDRSIEAVEPTGQRQKRMQSPQQLREHREPDGEPEYVPEHVEMSFEDT